MKKHEIIVAKANAKVKPTDATRYQICVFGDKPANGFAPTLDADKDASAVVEVVDILARATRERSALANARAFALDLYPNAIKAVLPYCDASRTDANGANVLALARSALVKVERWEAANDYAATKARTPDEREEAIAVATAAIWETLANGFKGNMHDLRYVGFKAIRAMYEREHYRDAEIIPDAENILHAVPCRDNMPRPTCPELDASVRAAIVAGNLTDEQSTVIDERGAGVSFDDIANALGISRQTAYTMFYRALRRVTLALLDNADALDALESIGVSDVDALVALGEVMRRARYARNEGDKVVASCAKDIRALADGGASLADMRDEYYLVYYSPDNKSVPSELNMRMLERLFTERYVETFDN